ncbi:hypothetical protein DNTS_026829 [Danionella cerebrum]|uniref:Uncharacterized protein n=1 Tax=Danionella cerebrum TaxID=2873325 RepID=A0A553N4Q8_9TELE|nr:hypothetical protein DNTS_026829 [Danionella translucida]
MKSSCSPTSIEQPPLIVQEDCVPLVIVSGSLRDDMGNLLSFKYSQLSQLKNTELETAGKSALENRLPDLATERAFTNSSWVFFTVLLFLTLTDFAALSVDSWRFVLGRCSSHNFPSEFTNNTSCEASFSCIGTMVKGSGSFCSTESEPPLLLLIARETLMLFSSVKLDSWMPGAF